MRGVAGGAVIPSRAHSRTITAFRLATATLLPHRLPIRAITGWRRLGTRRGVGIIFFLQEIIMRRVTAFCTAAGIAASSLAVVSPAQAGYYVIRWDNTGICQIWNEDLTSKPWQWPSTYKVVSKPIPTFTAAAAVQEKMRQERHCTL
jgi:hypothetical protein